MAPNQSRRCAGTGTRAGQLGREWNGGRGFAGSGLFYSDSFHCVL